MRHDDIDFGFGSDRRCGRRSFGNGVAERDVQVGANDPQNHAGDSAPRANVQDTVTRFEERFKGQRIDHVAADEFLEVRMSRQVELLVPIPQGGPIAVQLRNLIGRQMNVVAEQRGGEFEGVGIFDGMVSRSWVGRG